MHLRRRLLRPNPSPHSVNVSLDLTTQDKIRLARAKALQGGRIAQVDSESGASGSELVQASKDASFSLLALKANRKNQDRDDSHKQQESDSAKHVSIKPTSHVAPSKILDIGGRGSIAIIPFLRLAGHE